MEFDFAKARIGAMLAALNKQGAILLRGVVGPEVAGRYRKALDRIYELDRLGMIDGLPDNERKALDRGDVWPGTFEHYSDLGFDSYFALPRLRALIARLLGPSDVLNRTFLTVSDSEKQAIGGIQMHTDGIIQGTREAVVACWSPLHACGREAPGLSVIPASRQRVTAYLQRAFPDKKIPGWCSHEEWASAFNSADLSGEFGPAWTPEMEPGDVLVFTNWTIHGSQKARGHRSAIVQRWVGERWRKSLFHRLTGCRTR
jgi:hypothetical protein